MTVQNNLELQGNFATHPFAEVLLEVSQAELSGSLRLSFGDRKSIIYFENGKVVFGVSNSRSFKLLEIIASHHPEKATSELSGFANDLELVKHLRSQQSFSDATVDELLAYQLNSIILDIIGWPDGDWKFDPLARARSDIRARIDLGTVLFDHSRSLSTEVIIDRFRSMSEKFTQLPGTETDIALGPSEAFVFSRLEGPPQMVKDIIAVSGLEESLVLKTLYSLWLGGLVVRSDWNSALSTTKIGSIKSANLVLKRSATPITKIGKKAEAKPEPSIQPRTEAKPEKTETVISVGDYLKRAESAGSLYDVLGVAHDCSMAAIRKSYFSLAKQFHPDKFHRGDAALLRRIETAFSTLAQAYETLKDTKTRELYDSKLKRERNERASREPQTATTADSNLVHSERAAQEFEHGRKLLMDGEWEEALPFLARAVHFVPGNARYHAFYGKALSLDENQQHKAVNSMQKAVSLDPQNAAFRMMLAEFLIKVNLIKRAEGELTRLLQLQPDHREARSLLDSLVRK